MRRAPNHLWLILAKIKADPESNWTSREQWFSAGGASSPRDGGEKMLRASVSRGQRCCWTPAPCQDSPHSQERSGPKRQQRSAERSRSRSNLPIGNKDQTVKWGQEDGLSQSPDAENSTAQIIPFLQQIHGIKMEGGRDTEVNFLDTKPKMQGAAITWILIQIKQL